MPKRTITMTSEYNPMYNGSKKFHELYAMPQTTYSAIPLISNSADMPNSIFLGKAFSSIKGAKMRSAY